MAEFDVVVIGGGPAGTGAACALADKGRRVLVIDPQSPPAPRVETIVSGGERLARALGLGDAIDAAALGRAQATRMAWRAQPETIDHGTNGPLLVDRQRLHVGLNRAARTRGVTFFVGRVRGIRTGPNSTTIALDSRHFTAPVVIDARGRAGMRGGAVPVLVALAFAGQLTRLPQAELILEALELGWLWAAYAPHGLVSGAIFLPAVSVAGMNAARRLNVAHVALAGSSLLAAMALHGIWRPQAAALVATDEPVPAPALIRIGDRALAQDPIASQGISHALRSAAHAAAAADTMLTPCGDSNAARSFIRARHAAAVSVSQAARARAYADQLRRPGAQWLAGHRLEQPATKAGPPQIGALALSGDLRRVAVLRDGKIDWARAIALPASGGMAAYFGAISAEQLVPLLADPAPLATLVERLGQICRPDAARRIVDALWSEGALVAAGNPTAATPG